MVEIDEVDYLASANIDVVAHVALTPTLILFGCNAYTLVGRDIHIIRVMNVIHIDNTHDIFMVGQSYHTDHNHGIILSFRSYFQN